MRARWRAAWACATTRSPIDADVRRVLRLARRQFAGPRLGHHRGKHPGAHPRHAADGAVEQDRLDRAHHRQQERDGGGLLHAVRRHGRRLCGDQGHLPRRWSTGWRATATALAGDPRAHPRRARRAPSCAPTRPTRTACRRTKCSTRSSSCTWSRTLACAQIIAAGYAGGRRAAGHAPHPAQRIQAAPGAGRHPRHAPRASAATGVIRSPIAFRRRGDDCLRNAVRRTARVTTLVEERARETNHRHHQAVQARRGARGAGRGRRHGADRYRRQGLRAPEGAHRAVSGRRIRGRLPAQDQDRGGGGDSILSSAPSTRSRARRAPARSATARSSCGRSSR